MPRAPTYKLLCRRLTAPLIEKSIPTVGYYYNYYFVSTVAYSVVQRRAYTVLFYAHKHTHIH